MHKVGVDKNGETQNGWGVDYAVQPTGQSATTTVIGSVTALIPRYTNRS